MFEEKLHWVPPRGFHEQQAAHYRELAETATTRAIKARLLREAENHEQAAKEMASRGAPYPHRAV